MSFFIRNMPADGLRSSPPVSNTTPLPHRLTSGEASPAPLPRHSSSATTGGRSEPAPTAAMAGYAAASASPSVRAKRAPNSSATARAASANSCGPSRLAGVLIRSRASPTERAASRTAAISAPSGIASLAGPRPVAVRRPANR